MTDVVWVLALLWVPGLLLLSGVVTAKTSHWTPEKAQCFAELLEQAMACPLGTGPGPEALERVTETLLLDVADRHPPTHRHEPAAAAC